MVLYAISGLGADKRIFDFLKLPSNPIVLHWLTPLPFETVPNYARRMCGQIDNSLPFGLIGVSFGGAVAIEMCKIIKPSFLVLLSSVETSAHLPISYRIVGATKLISILPSRCFTPPACFAIYFFGAKNTDLLRNILKDTNPAFTKWAVQALLSWKNNQSYEPMLKIHGDCDKIIPHKPGLNTIIIAKGSHFMVVDMAPDVSAHISAFMRLHMH